MDETTPPPATLTLGPAGGEPGDPPDKPSGLVEVVWEDAVSDDPWKSLAEALQEADDSEHLIHSVGYMLRETDQYIFMGGSTDMLRDVCMTLKIPRGMVRSITPLTRLPGAIKDDLHVREEASQAHLQTQEVRQDLHPTDLSP